MDIYPSKGVKLVVDMVIADANKPYILEHPHALDDLDRAPHVTAALHPVPDVGRGAAVAVAGLGRCCCRHLLRALAAQYHPGVESGPNNLLDPHRLRSD